MLFYYMIGTKSDRVIQVTWTGRHRYRIFRNRFRSELFNYSLHFYCVF